MTMTTTTTTTMTTTDADADVLRELAGLLNADLRSITPLHREATAAGFLTGYLLELLTAGGEAVQQTVYLEAKPPDAERPGVVRFAERQGDGVIDAWLYPNDPALPALGAAVYPEAAAVLLARLGWPVRQPALELVTYRPGKRAVIRVAGGSQVVFLKVVRPKVVERIQAAHASWADAGVPVPRSLGWAPDGLIALEDLGGRGADSALQHAESREALLDDVCALMDVIAAVRSSVPARASLFTRLDWYGRRLVGIAPDHAVRIETLSSAIRRRFDSAQPAEQRTIHGDFHLGQLRVLSEAPTSICGLLDIDTAGLGDPADDLGAFAGHAIATAALESSRGAAASAAAWAQLADSWISRFPESDGVGDRARAITATHLLAHALTGTAPTGLLLLQAQGVLDETVLMAASFSSHPRSGS
jgi:hypothetical protein